MSFDLSKLGTRQFLEHVYRISTILSSLPVHTPASVTKQYNLVLYRPNDGKTLQLRSEP